MTATDRDLRFDTPLYSLAEAARFLDVPSATFASWRTDYLDRDSEGRASDGPTHTAHRSDTGPTVPFVALAEGIVLAAIRKTGVPIQRIHPTLMALQEETGLDHALAHRGLYSDGAEILDDFAKRSAEPGVAQLTKQLVVLRNGQRVFTDTVIEHLERIEYADDGYAKLVHLPGYRRRQLIVDPARAFGQPVFARGAAKVSDVMDRFHAGESLTDLSEDFGVPLDDLEDALRVTSRWDV